MYFEEPRPRSRRLSGSTRGGESVSFWAPAAGAVVTAIEGEDYRGVPTFRDPAVLLQQARARGLGSPRASDP